MQSTTGGADSPALDPQPRVWLFRSRWASAILTIVGGLTLLFLLVLAHVSQGQADIGFSDALRAIVSPDGSPTDNIVRYIRLPRTMIGILCGAALAMAGVLMQSVIRNPLASPSTLGVTSGAYLALVVTTIFAPGILGFSPLAIAFFGGTIAALLAYGIAGSVSLTPIRLALAGVAVSLVCSAVTAVLQLFYEYQVSGLFFWGAGSLAQSDWGGTTYALPRLLVGAVLALLMGRSLDVLALGDDVARSLGQRIRMIRAAGLMLGIFLAAVAVSVVGPIVFIGLIVPHFVRLLGIRTHRLLLVGTAIWGGVILLAADVLSRLVISNVTELPTGGITAIIGAPVFILLARYSSSLVGSREVVRSTVSRGGRGIPVSYPVLLSLLGLMLVGAMMIGLMFGDVWIDLPLLFDTLRGQGTDLSHRILIELRLPRTLVAAVAGAALALSGVLLQGVLRNPLAGPEIVGVTGGAGLGALTVLVLFPGLPFAAVPIAAFVGSFAAFGIVYLAAWQGGGTGPARLALIGIAVSAFCAAGINLLVVMAQLRVAQALVWLSGSTYARGWDSLLQLAPWILVLFPVAMIAARHLDIIRLGDYAAQGLGMPLERVRIGILTVAVSLAAAAVSVVGTVSFVGLIGPHSARLMLGTDSHHRKLVPVSALLGAIIVVVADIIGRSIISPKEIPSGLVTTLIGAPYFLWLLWRSRRPSKGWGKE